MFQSLLGFLMRCDSQKAACRHIGDTVSIPVGFSDALRLDKHNVSEDRLKVSIPVGFSDALRLVIGVALAML